MPSARVPVLAFEAPSTGSAVAPIELGAAEARDLFAPTGLARLSFVRDGRPHVTLAAYHAVGSHLVVVAVPEIEWAGWGRPVGRSVELEVDGVDSSGEWAHSAILHGRGRVLGPLGDPDLPRGYDDLPIGERAPHAAGPALLLGLIVTDVTGRRVPRPSADFEGGAQSEPAPVRLPMAADLLEIVGSTPVGRLVRSEDGRPTAVPVNHAVHDGRIHVCLGHHLGRRIADGDPVAFEVGAIDGDRGWSIVVDGRIGSTSTFDGPPRSGPHRVSGVQPWAPGIRHEWFAIEPQRFHRTSFPGAAALEAPPLDPDRSME